MKNSSYSLFVRTSVHFPSFFSCLTTNDTLYINTATEGSNFFLGSSGAIVFGYQTPKNTTATSIFTIYEKKHNNICQEVWMFENVWKNLHTFFIHCKMKKHVQRQVVVEIMNEMYEDVWRIFSIP